MKIVERIGAAIVSHSKITIAVMVLATVAIGTGAPMVEQSSSLDQFQTDSPESEKLDVIEKRFSNRENSTTTAQVIVRADRGENVLTKQNVLAVLEYQQTLRDEPVVNDTLVEEAPIVGLPNVVATAAIRGEQAATLQKRATSLQADRAAIQENKTTLERRRTELNETARGLKRALGFLQQNPDADPVVAFQRVNEETNVSLDAEDERQFQEAAAMLRTASNRSDIESAYELGTRALLAAEYRTLQERGDALEERGAALQQRAQNLTEQTQALENAPSPPLSEQIEHLESMNESAVANVVQDVLGPGDGADGNGAGSQVLSLMPTAYEPGDEFANATMLVLTQRATTDGAPGAAGQAVRDAQLSMQELGTTAGNGLEYMVFGSGVIAHEIDSSMADSMTIVGPLALLFVLVALGVGYRDVLDIVLGVFGIVAVLIWTFGFMGWATIDFNQLFIAVPVLLIGLSIDYAIHTFMRHREERLDLDDGTRAGMRVALGGVGVALVWVTATTVIGFLSNLTSPVPPIREFGIVSSFGIASALLVFGALVPALKVELDDFLEARGFDRRKRAIGTGGGYSTRVLSIGASAARRSPAVLVIFVLLITGMAAVGASQVDTEFNQADFLADDPPDWMKDLPEPFAPGEYHAKANLNYVNNNFLREDSTSEFLIEGDLAPPDTLERLSAAQSSAADKPVTTEISGGGAAIESPLTVMASVAASNESFNATFTAADTDGNGVPDRNLTAVYAAFFDAAPEQAGQYLSREDGGYTAAQMVVNVDGRASGDDITEQMRAVAASLESGTDLTVTATGQPILNKIVQDELLATVVQSLAITLVVVFLFLMLAYRVTDGSASLGAVTLVPVALSVAWILGTMFLLDIPFNVLTGMITSLTIGLGVAYSIHLSERYTQELERSETVWGAMGTAVTGTGGALVGSAATTVGGFGVLVFSILPPLQQFGLITGLTIIYALLGSVLVLPSLLVGWTRFFGPAWAREQITAGTSAGGTDDVAGAEAPGDSSAAPGDSADSTGSAGVAKSPDPEDDD